MLRHRGWFYTRAVLLILVRYGVVMILRFLSGAVGAAVVVVAAVAPAWADPDPMPAPPPLPDVNAYAPISPVDYAAMEGNWYAFAGPVGVTCVIPAAGPSPAQRLPADQRRLWMQWRTARRARRRRPGQRWTHRVADVLPRR